MSHYWQGKQKALLKQYKEKGAQWVTDECNKVPNGPHRTLIAVMKKARQLGYAAKGDESRYLVTDQIDDVIRRAYASGSSGAVRRAADACKRPQWWICDRARELDLPPLKQPPFRIYSDREESCIRTNAHLPASAIAELLRKEGYRRSPDMIRKFLRTREVEAARDTPLSATEVAGLLGIHVTTLTSQIKRGLLLCKRVGPMDGRTSSPFLIEPKAIAAYAVRYPEAVDLRKVDPIWFIDLIATFGPGLKRESRQGLIHRVGQMVRECPELETHAIADRLGVSDHFASDLASKARSTLTKAPSREAA